VVSITREPACCLKGHVGFTGEASDALRLELDEQQFVLFHDFDAGSNLDSLMALLAGLLQD
jgi:hypothetical protein